MLTDAQKTAIRRHLGLNAASPALYPWVPTFYTVTQILDTLPAATEAEVVTLLDRLAAIETSLDDARKRLKATGVGSISLNRNELDQLWRERRRWIGQLSTISGVPCVTSGPTVVVV